MSRHTYSFLALGDSYTIGESLPIHESFPYQLVQVLRGQGHYFHPPEIVAKTGWTTSELAKHVIHLHLNPQYDFVTLLIGVNNQYRGQKINDYETDFDFLLRKAIHLAGENPGNVLVLSIPDWGVTPFAEGRDRKQISAEIDAYNAINKSLSQKYDCHYIDITPGTREAESNGTLVAEDKLHPSHKEYSRWAAAVAEIISSVISG